MDLRAHTVARLLAGRPLPLIGRLLADVTRAGAVALLDPETGAEVRAADDRPAFVLSTEGEASDGHIVRQEWDLSRASAGGPGAPVLWNHNQDVLLGQWQDLTVQSLDGGPALVGRAYFDPDDDLAQKRKGQVKRGFLSAVSVGWMPGERTRRGELAADDPAYRAPVDGMCGPEEGLVMGSRTSPNMLIEASIVPCPAQASAVVTERFFRRGGEALARALGAPGDADPDALLAFLANHPRARAWLSAEIARGVRAEMALIATTPPLAGRSVGDLLRG